ncbi:MAG: GNAT family N-acetyltransferase [Thermoguttaceae bacterium]
MSEMNIIEVKNNREKRQVQQLPWSLYKDDPYWIPPLRIDQKELLGYVPCPFYERNAVQTFLAVQKGQPVGRIAAIHNVGHTERYNDGVGFFGFFESIDDTEVSTALLQAAEKWLKDRGLTAMRGPVNPSLNHTLGLLIEGFDSSPFFMMTYNPPYYERLIEEAGLRKVQDLYSYWGDIQMLPKIREKLEPLCKSIMDRTGVRVRHLNKRCFQQEVETFLHIYNESLTNTWGFVPMSDAEVKATAFALRFLIVPELAIAVELNNKVVGAAFCLPDYNPRIKAIDGRLFPLGFLRLMWNKRSIKKIRILSANVLPEYQMQGLGLVLMDALVPSVLKYGIQEAEFSWVLESNRFSRGSLEKGGAVRTKTYRVYQKDLDEGISKNAVCLESSR